jgi:hypothetical protein
MSKSYMSSNFVNGPSCSYARLKTYANCARAEVRPAVPVSVAAAATPAPVAVAAPAPAPVAVAAPAVAEGYLDPSPYSLPGSANTGITNYTPSYNVPNYAPIALDALTTSDATCGGYRKILSAYGGMNGSSCTTNYINN